MAIIKNAIKDMESVMKPETVDEVNKKINKMFKIKDWIIGFRARGKGKELYIKEGYANDDKNKCKIISDEEIVKIIDKEWEQGQYKGALDVGTINSKTPYFIFVIMKKYFFFFKKCDILISVSKKTPVLPRGYKYKRLIGTIMTNENKDIANLQWRK